jgi:hypothetical protein
VAGRRTWTDPQWRAAATGWVDDELKHAGLTRTGPPEEIKQRAWSVVWRLPTDGGPVWFKANGGDTRYEAPLAAALARWVPARVIVPYAIDAERGWQLLPDAGPSLRDADAATDPATWAAFAADYARLQRDLTPYADDMIALGVPDQRPHRLPELAEALVADPAVALADEDRARLAERLPEYRDWCARLAEAGPAPGLNHDDLHDGNVLVGTGGGYGFFDWGDASVAHPFSVLLVTLRACASTFDLAPDDPAVLRVRDAYLDVFGDDGFGDPADLLDLARVATQAAKVGRALSWRRGLVDAEAADLAEFGDAVPGWLAEILTPGPL